jgi:hypothetical protein
MLSSLTGICLLGHLVESARHFVQYQHAAKQRATLRILPRLFFAGGKFTEGWVDHIEVALQRAIDQRRNSQIWELVQHNILVYDRQSPT